MQVLFQALVFRHKEEEKGLQGEIYLCRLPEGDWHMPQTFYQQDEAHDLMVCPRLEDDFGTSVVLHSLFDHNIERISGTIIHCLVHLVKLEAEPRVDENHQWFTLNNLPTSISRLYRMLVIPAAFYEFSHSQLWSLAYEIASSQP